MSNKERFYELIKSVEKITPAFLNWLESTDYFTAPASTKFHSSYEGGLLAHSLNVYDNLVKLIKDNNLDITNEEAVIIGLFHDLCKVNTYKVEYRNAKNELGVWVKVPYYTYEEQSPLGIHGDKSVMLLQIFMNLTKNELYGIRYHMSAFEGEKVISTLSNAINNCPNILWVHLADQLATLGE